MDASRREFLIKLAKGTVYAAPLVVTLSVPESLTAQAPASQKMGGGSKGKGMGGGGAGGAAPSGSSAPATGPTPPWAAPPP